MAHEDRPITTNCKRNLDRDIQPSSKKAKSGDQKYICQHNKKGKSNIVLSMVPHTKRPVDCM